MDKPIKMGCLLVPSQGLLKKSWQKKWIALFAQSSFGIQRLEHYDREDQLKKRTPTKTILLNDCIKIVRNIQKNHVYTIEIKTKNKAYYLAADTESEYTDWITTIQAAAFMGEQIRVSGSKESTPIQRRRGSGGSIRWTDTQLEDSARYSSLDNPQVFRVKMVDNDAAKRCTLKGDYDLVLNPLTMAIVDPKTDWKKGKSVYIWPYRYIRRYGSNRDSFSLEAGRKCPSGEGYFSFETHEGSTIFQTVDRFVKAMRQRERKDLPGEASPRVVHSNESVAIKDSFAVIKEESRKRPDENILVDQLKKSSLNNEPINTPQEIVQPEQMYAVVSKKSKSNRQKKPEKPEHVYDDAYFEPPLPEPPRKLSIIKNIGIENPGDLLYCNPEDPKGDAWKVFGLETNSSVEQYPFKSEITYDTPEGNDDDTLPIRRAFHTKVDKEEIEEDSTYDRLGKVLVKPSTKPSISHNEHLYSSLQIKPLQQDFVYSEIGEYSTPTKVIATKVKPLKH